MDIAIKKNSTSSLTQWDVTLSASMEPVQFEPIGDNTACNAEGCQHLYSMYTALYGTYVGVVMANHGLVAVNKELNNHKQCKIDLLQEELRVTKNQLAEANVMLDGLQGNLEPELSTDWAPTCPGCVKHRTALVIQRNLSRNNQEKTRAIGLDCNATLDQLIVEYKTIQRENGILRVKQAQTPCPFWHETAYKHLEDEVKRQKALVYEANRRASEYERDRDRAQIMLELATKRANSAEKKLCDELFNVGQKRKLEEEVVEEDDVNVEPDAQLVEKLISVFSITRTPSSEIEEKVLYDTFMKCTPAADHERFLEAMYRACHPGESRMPQSQRKKIPQIGEENGPQVCKASFAACLRAVGGVCRKRGSSNVWVNVKPRRSG